MAKLDLDSFNEILFQALKDGSVKGQIELIEAELSMTADIFYTEMGYLMDDLLAEGYESERFTKLKNIKANSEGLLEKLEELRAQLPEEEKDNV